MAKLTFHGYATCSLGTDDGTHFVIDPFFRDTWPPIEQDAEALKATMGSRAHVGIMAPGDTYEF